MAAIYELQQSLSILAGTSTPPYLEAQQAANVWAGSSNLDLLAALNCKHYGTTTPDPTHVPLGLNAVCNALNGGGNREAQDALSMLAGGGHT